MKQKLNRVLSVVAISTLVAGGCAKKEIVKNEEPIAVVAGTPSATVSKQEIRQDQVEAKKEKEAADQVQNEAAHEVIPLQDAARLTAKHDPIYFDFDSALLTSAARKQLLEHASVMKNEPDNIIIEGHCDERGSDEYNLALGETRAKAAMAYLMTLGVPADRLSVISYGKERPADSAHDDSAWAKNRRDEFVAAP